MTRIGDDSAGRRIELPGRPGESVTLAWAAITDVGHRRRANEDSVLVVPPLFAVADGMGGHAAGDRASAAVIHRLAELGGDYSAPGHVKGALISAASDIDEIAEGIAVGAGTTITGAALALDAGEPVFAVFNIGDSRVYRFEGNELTQITVDHSVVQELVDSGVISAQDAEHHPESNVITRALGFHETPHPDFWTLPVHTGLRLMICSDGLTKELGRDRLRLHLAAGMSASETAAALVDAALAAGGRDNVTLVIVDVLDAPAVRATPDREEAHSGPSSRGGTP